MNTKSLRIAVVGIVLATIATAALAQGVATRIAVFDPQRVSEETAEGQRIQAELTAFQTRKQQELTTKQEEIQTLRQQLTAQAISLSSDKRAELEKSIQKKILEFQSAEESANRELQLEIANAQAQFEQKILAVVEQFGRDEGFTLILNIAAVAWASPTVDVTTAIVDRFNQMTESSAAGAGAGG